MNTMYKLKDNSIILDGKQNPKIKQYHLKIRDLPKDDQPREKLVKHGPTALSVPELLSIVLMTGTVKESLIDMTSRIVKDYGEKSILHETDVNKLSTTVDIPITKAAQIVACGELGRRFYQKNESGFATIRSAKDVYDYLKDMHNLPKEHLRGLYLNTHHRVIHMEVISIGTINSNLIHPREVFRPAIEYNAAAVVLAHNHPSNIAIPSDEDIQVTKQLIEAGNLIGINVLDHVIITKDGFKSIEAKY